MKKLFLILFCVMCLQPVSFRLAAQSDSVKDIDGNYYHVVKIGKQKWLQENLKTTRFQDGTAIPEIKDATVWDKCGRTHSPAWSYYKNDEKYNDIYGKLYNWFAASDPHNMCPAGWHVPSDDDYEWLMAYVGGDSVAGAHMRAIPLWRKSTAAKSDNTSGFSALPGEFRDNFGDFIPNGKDEEDDRGYYGVFWSSTPDSGYDAKYIGLYFSYKNAYGSIFNKGDGMSVRCIAN